MLHVLYAQKIIAYLNYIIVIINMYKWSKFVDHLTRVWEWLELLGINTTFSIVSAISYLSDLMGGGQIRKKINKLLVETSVLLRGLETITFVVDKNVLEHTPRCQSLIIISWSLYHLNWRLLHRCHTWGMNCLLFRGTFHHRFLVIFVLLNL